MIKRVIPHYDGTRMIECNVPESVKDLEAWINQEVESTSSDASSAVGFDVEWKPHNRVGQRHRVSLIQLARPDSVLLVQLHRHKGMVPKALSSLINSKHIVKAGVGVLDDLKRIEEDHGLDVSEAAFVDLGAVSKRYEVTESLLNRNKDAAGASSSLSETDSLDDDGVGKMMKPAEVRADGNYVENSMKNKGGGFGLAMLAEKYIGARPNKPKSIQLSNWERYELTNDQMQYAAYDAHMGIDVYDHLRGLGALDVDASLHIRQFSPLFWAASSSKPVHRTHVRNLWLRASESSFLLDQAGEHLMREDEKWLEQLSNSRMNLDEGNRETVTWSKAMLAVLSRFGVTPKYVLTPTRGTIGGGEPWAVMVVYKNHILAKGTGRSKAVAREVACEKVLIDLMRMQEQEIAKGGRTELFSAYAGKAPLPTCFTQYLSKKRRLAAE